MFCEIKKIELDVCVVTLSDSSFSWCSALLCSASSFTKYDVHLGQKSSRIVLSIKFQELYRPALSTSTVFETLFSHNLWNIYNSTLFLQLVPQPLWLCILSSTHWLQVQTVVIMTLRVSSLEMKGYTIGLLGSSINPYLPNILAISLKLYFLDLNFFWCLTNASGGQWTTETTQFCQRANLAK